MFPALFIHQPSVLVPEQTSSRGKVLLEKDLVDLEETRVRPISGVDHVAVDPIVLYKVC